MSTVIEIKNLKHKKAEVVLLISEKVDFKINSTKYR